MYVVGLYKVCAWTGCKGRRGEGREAQGKRKENRGHGILHNKNGTTDCICSKVCFLSSSCLRYPNYTHYVPVPTAARSRRLRPRPRLSSAPRLLSNARTIKTSLPIETVVSPLDHHLNAMPSRRSPTQKKHRTPENQRPKSIFSESLIGRQEAFT